MSDIPASDACPGCCDYELEGKACVAVALEGLEDKRLGDEKGWLRYRKSLDCVSEHVAKLGEAVWLDVGCGPGNAFEMLRNFTGKTDLNQVRFVLVDTSESCLAQCENKIRQIVGGRADVVKVRCNFHELDVLEAKLEKTESIPFDHISFVNCLHEADPLHIPSLLSLLIRLCRPSTGTIYISDHDPLFELELGALPWPYSLFVDFFDYFCDSHGGLHPAPLYQPRVDARGHGRFPGFNVRLKRDGSAVTSDPEKEGRLRQWIESRLEGVQRKAEWDLLHIWNGHLQEQTRPGNDGQRRIYTEIVRIATCHFHKRHRRDGGALC